MKTMRNNFEKALRLTSIMVFILLTLFFASDSSFASERNNDIRWEKETNDNVESADELYAVDRVYGYFNEKSDTDYFKIELERAGDLTLISLEEHQKDDLYSMKLEDELGNVISESEYSISKGLSYRWIYEKNLPKGDYYVVVKPLNFELIGENYNIESRFEAIEDYKEIESIDIETNELYLKLGESYLLGYIPVPYDATEPVRFESSDDNVATIDDDGKIKTNNYGSCILTISNKKGTISNELHLYVESDGELLSLNFEEMNYEIERGDIVDFKKMLGLADDEYYQMEWSIDADLGNITDEGMFYSDSLGTASLKVQYRDLQAFTSINVLESDASVERRAIIVGNADYPEDSSDLLGPVHDAKRMESLFESADFDGDGEFVSIERLENITRTELEEAIDEIKEVTGKEDITYFYYSGHGIRYHTISALSMMYDDISVPELKALLDEIPGTKVVFLDACFAGGFIAKGDTEYSSDIDDINDINDEIIATFQVSSKGDNTLQEGAYKVIAASSESEVSAEYDGNPPYGLFTKILVDASGYRGEVLSDANEDGELTIDETYKYVYRQVFDENDSQHVQVYPENSDFTWFSYGDISIDEEIGSQSEDKDPDEGIEFYKDVIIENSEKVWTIDFNSNVSKDSIVNGIYISETRAGDKLDGVNLEIRGSSVLLNPPSDGWEYDRYYYIHVNNNVKSDAGKSLKESKIVRFKVEK